MGYKGSHTYSQCRVHHHPADAGRAARRRHPAEAQQRLCRSHHRGNHRAGVHLQRVPQRRLVRRRPVVHPPAYSVNTLLMPLLWLFVRRNFSPRTPFRPLRLLHFAPAALCLVLFSAWFFSMPPEARLAYIAYENTGADTPIGSLNALVVFVQMFAYYALIFRYLHRMKDYIRQNLSDAELLRRLWIPRFMTLTAALFLVVFVAYVLWPRTDAWLIQILNVVMMGYLVYKELPLPMPPCRTPPQNPQNPPPPKRPLPRQTTPPRRPLHPCRYGTPPRLCRPGEAIPRNLRRIYQSRPLY